MIKFHFTEMEWLVFRCKTLIIHIAGISVPNRETSMFRSKREFLRTTLAFHCRVYMYV